jgi:metal-sulfur cluster biosynthetic enzyme
MAERTLRYKLDEKGMEVMLGCASAHLIEEQSEAIAQAFKEIEVTINVDDDWGFCTITHVNGREVKDT